MNALDSTPMPVVRLDPATPSSWPACWQALVTALVEGTGRAALEDADAIRQHRRPHPWPQAWQADVPAGPVSSLKARAVVAGWMRAYVAAAEEKAQKPVEDRTTKRERAAPLSPERRAELLAALDHRAPRPAPSARASSPPLRRRSPSGPNTAASLPRGDREDET